ncbi:phage tail tape measure protein [Methylobacterium frigidaeris]|uniref:Phage tail tape measure protein domain-containing protein n=1 Tax=Methylobacterium frigidaeris TaxID=2038277 RepID=A0AA37HFP1_9HYPH|nr:phage tail tape measure protein [Methylobacterium frigidaeris]PIK74816.1 phage tail tape measure protein [Methylobacterium frigidaeris]GJD65176.1 hypothetical protein MPEAHAMD_5363 [Methylobacterium frigidaeris]
MGRIIEAKAVISAEDRTGKVFDQIARKFRDVGKGAKVAAEVDRLSRSLKAAQDNLKAIDGYQGKRNAFFSARADLQAARKGADEAARSLANAAKPTKALEQNLRKAQAAADAAAAAFERQKAAVLAARSTLAQGGVAITSLIGEQKRLAKAVDQTSAAIQRQHALARAEGGMTAGMSDHGRRQMAKIAQDRYVAEGMGAAGRAALAERERRQAAAQAERERIAQEAADARKARRDDRREAATVLGAGAAVVAGHHGKTIAKDAITSAAEFDLAVRKQKVFTDISDADQAGLLAQAKQIGQETQFSNIDVVKAQTAAMQGLPAGFSATLKAEVAQGIVANVRNYSTLMETDLKDGAETIRGYLQQTGKDISTKEKALFEANKATNQLVKMAKLGGMNGEDVAQYAKFAASSGTSAGLSSDTLMSLAALARRGGLRGDEAGTFIRSAAGKLVSPTNPGLAALNAAGIKFSDYVTMPKQLSTSALEGQFQLKMGKSFTPAVRAKLDKINADASLIGDRGKYTEAVVSAVGDILGKNKKGTVKAQDARVAAKAVEGFHKVSALSVDSERLLDDAMSKNMTLPQLNAWLTDKHGGKGAITQRQWDEFKQARQQIGHAADDPDWAKKKADEVFAGLGGAVENLRGSFENLVLTIGNANAGLIKWSADKLGAGLDQFSKLPEGAQQGLSLGAGAGLTAASAWGTLTLLRRVLGLGGAAAGGAGAAGAGAGAAAGGAAATGAGAAAAGAAAGGLPGAAAAGGAATLGAAAVATATLAGAAVAGYATAKALPDAVKRGAADPATGGALDANPLGAFAREKGAAPPLQAWWRRTMPTWAGGDPSGQVGALSNTLDKATGAAATAANGGKPVEATVKPDQIQANVKPDQITAKVEGQAQVNVTVKVDGPGQVTGMSASSSGNVQANAGTRGRSMPQAAGNPGGA